MTDRSRTVTDTFSKASLWDSRSRWVYLSVIFIEECPNNFPTTSIGVPELTSWEAKECLSSWILILDTPAFLQAFVQYLRKVVSVYGLPVFAFTNKNPSGSDDDTGLRHRMGY
jgi:hypothetical protein